jgi:hypothetical protein
LTLDKLKNIFEKISNTDNFNLQLLQIRTSKRAGTTYTTREIVLSPERTLCNFTKEMSERYVNKEKGILKSYIGIKDYDGSTVDKMVYKLSAENEMILDDFNSLISSIAKPDLEINPLEFSAQAYLIKCVIDDVPIKLVSMQNPVTSLKHKFWSSNGTFKQISDKVISLKTSIDVVIIDRDVYMLTLAGENLFNIERAYKFICKAKVLEIRECDIVSDIDSFTTIASRGHNPRKFVSFNDSHLQKLKDVKFRTKISKKFNIPMIKDKFDTSNPDVADKIVKLLCDRGMVDPFDNNPMEVAGSKKWE